MPQVIDRARVRELTQSGAPLIDVLPTKQYEDAHIKGAISIPLTKLNQSSTQQMSQDNPIIVYCNDYQ